jgi:hypothetical protein
MALDHGRPSGGVRWGWTLPNVGPIARLCEPDDVTKYLVTALATGLVKREDRLTSGAILSRGGWPTWRRASGEALPIAGGHRTTVTLASAHVVSWLLGEPGRPAPYKATFRIPCKCQET